MRRLLFILILCLPASAQIKPMLGTPMDYSNPLTDGLIFYMPFNEATGNRVNDVSGNGHAGTFSSASVTWASTLRGRAVKFDGTGDYIDCGAGFNLSAITLSAWVRCDSIVDSYPRIIGSEGDWSIYIHSTGLMGWYGSGTDYAFSLVSFHDLRDGKWHHVCVTYGTDAYVRGYVDCVYVGSVILASGLDASATVAIGGRVAGGRTLNGCVAEAAIYNRALSPSEIKSLYDDPYQLFAEDDIQYVEAGEEPAGTGQVIMMGSLIPLLLIFARLRRTEARLRQWRGLF